MIRLRLIVGMIVAAMVLPLGTSFGAAQEGMFAPPDEGEAMDLAAMALTPDDLDDLGFADFLIADGRSQSLEDRVAEQASNTADAETIRAFLTDLGWIRGYRSRLAHPIEAGVEDFDALISSGITQFSDEANAKRGWTLISGLDVDAGEGAEVRDAESIGDESRTLEITPQSFGGDEMHPGLRIVFRSGTLVGDLIYFAQADATIDPDDVSPLAARQLQLMESVVADGAPGLSLQVLRWQGDSIADPDVDNYVKLDGDGFVGLGDSAQDIAQAETNFADAIDHYRYEAQLVPTLFQYTSLATFEDAEVAEAWVTEAFDRTELNRPEGATLEEITDAPSLGDASVVLTLSTPIENGEAIGYGVFVQVGEIGLSLALISLGALDLDDVMAMAEAQVSCVTETDCTDSVPLPAWVS